MYYVLRFLIVLCNFEVKYITAYFKEELQLLELEQKEIPLEMEAREAIQSLRYIF